jgi:hypothetical protein
MSCAPELRQHRLTKFDLESPKPKEFSNAAREAVNDYLRAGTWKVWEKYDILDTYQGDDVYVYARENAIDDEYHPLVQTPGLFLEFAGLEDDGEITREVWLDWVERYGVLGLNWRGADELLATQLFGPVSQEGGPNESYNAFVREALEANWLLRLYESATSPEGSDVSKFRQEELKIYGLDESYRDPRDPNRSIRPTFLDTSRTKPDEAKKWALETVRDKVLAEIRECYPTLYYFPPARRYIQGWGFHSLVSAMYLQMMWLLTASDDQVRRCALPWCNKVITYEQPEQLMAGLQRNDRSKGYRTRRDKEYCDDDCKGAYHYHFRVKPRRQRNRS